MEILYTSNGIPVLNIDGVAYRFFSDDFNHILAELSLNPDKIEEIKNNTINYCNELQKTLKNLDNNSSYEEINKNIRIMNDILSVAPVFEMLKQAYDMYIMFNTLKPYDSWIWDSQILRWKAPIAYPTGIEGDGIYLWNENERIWEPVSIRPFPSWVWNKGKNEWEAPMKYPLDANQNDFIWNEDLLRWVANV